jgi:hypothetical protein
MTWSLGKNRPTHITKMRRRVEPRLRHLLEASSVLAGAGCTVSDAGVERGLNAERVHAAGGYA